MYRYKAAIPAREIGTEYVSTVASSGRRELQRTHSLIPIVVSLAVTFIEPIELSVGNLLANALCYLPRHPGRGRL